MTGPDILVAFLGAGGLAALVGFIKWLVDRRDRLIKERKEEQQAADDCDAERARIPEMFQAFNRLYSNMRELIDYPGCNRVVLLKASDSGRIPRIGIPLYVTVVAEVFGKGYKSIRPNWFNRPVDDQYIQTLIELSANGKATVHHHELKPGDILHDVYIVAGTAHSDMRLVLEHDSEMYFLSIHHNGEEPETAEYREHVVSLVTATHAILESELAAVQSAQKES